MRLSPEDTPAWATLRICWAQIWQVLRPGLGWLCLALGVLGIIFPLLPGIPILFLGMALVGRRNRLLRWTIMQQKRLLRRWAKHPTPVIRRVGQWATRQQRWLASRFPRRA
jgi:uncharacterized membrane protein YbaN (DUF454 family)